MKACEGFPIRQTTNRRLECEALKQLTYVINIEESNDYKKRTRITSFAPPDHVNEVSILIEEISNRHKAAL